jgi:ABC-type dipeptide/oligopeptide/nickel transport system permease subunit
MPHDSTPAASRLPLLRWIPPALPLLLLLGATLAARSGLEWIPRHDVPVLGPGELPPARPGPGHWLGTDGLGRDMASRLIAGAGTSLSVALAAQLLSLAVGVGVGAVAGLRGGRTDAILMRVTDLFLALPAPLILIAVMAAVPEPGEIPLLGAASEPATVMCLLALGLLGWGELARLARSGVLEARRLTFTEAARAAGAGPWRLLGFHLIPHALGPVWILASSGVGANILAESWLAFLGLGVRPPRPSWGAMIYEGTPYLVTHPWVCLFPGLALTFSVLGFHLLGDRLREIGVPQRPALVVALPGEARR